MIHSALAGASPSAALLADIKRTTRRYILENFLMGSLETELRDEDSFLDRHIVDSTGFLELVMHIEQTYGVVLEDNELTPDNLDSLNAIAAFVARKRGATA